MVDAAQLTHWLSRLVQIPSVAPEQSSPHSGPTGEAAMAAFVAQHFAQLGGEVIQHEVLPGRPNVYAIWRTDSPRWIGVDVHVDTVGVAQMSDPPFDGRVAQKRVWGRGAVDTKASLAVALSLLADLQQRGRRPAANLLIAATVDEEMGATGAPAFATWLREQGMVLDQLIVAEPTRCAPIHGHKGVVRLQFTIRGQSAHSSQPHKGRNAVVAGARLILALDQEHQRLQDPEFETPLGLPKLTVSLVHGGTGVNVVPDSCTVAMDRRVVVGEEAEAVGAQLMTLAQESSPLPVESTQILKYMDAFYQPPETPWVKELAAWSGAQPDVAPYGTNAWAYDGVTRQRIVLGPGSIDQAHGAQEWVEIAELEKLAGIYGRWWGEREDS